MRSELGAQNLKKPLGPFSAKQVQVKTLRNYERGVTKYLAYLSFGTFSFEFPLFLIVFQDSSFNLSKRLPRKGTESWPVFFSLKDKDSFYTTTVKNRYINFSRPKLTKKSAMLENSCMQQKQRAGQGLNFTTHYSNLQGLSIPRLIHEVISNIIPFRR